MKKLSIRLQIILLSNQSFSLLNPNTDEDFYKTTTTIGLLAHLMSWNHTDHVALSNLLVKVKKN
jgi:hypothetical protein